LEWLVQQNEEIVGLVIHPASAGKYVDEIIRASNVAPERIFDGSQLRNPDVLSAIEALQADLCLSILFNYILKSEFIRLFPKGVLNLHPSYLPYNRGQYPNVWSIVEGTPAGTTIHYIDEGVDTGDIVAQKRIPVDSVDTAESLYRKLEQASLRLFQETWPLIISGQPPRMKQTVENGTYHRTKDVEKIDQIDLDQEYKARDLINILRARTFPPYKGAFFEEEGKRIYMRLELEYGDDST
jgi:methionyl-tRNA formyltransferase